MRAQRKTLLSNAIRLIGEREEREIINAGSRDEKKAKQPLIHNVVEKYMRLK